MKTTQKILFLARWYPDCYDPMTGLFIKRHAEVAAGFANVSVLYLRAAPEKQFGYHIEKKVENGVDTNIVYYGTKSGLPDFLSKLLSGYLFAFAFIKGFRFILDTWGKPDILHVNVLTRLGVFALWLRFFKGIRYVITEHWSRYLPITGTYNGFWRKILTKIIVKYASAISTVSDNLAKAMQNHGLKNNHFLLLPNVVDCETYKPGTGKTSASRKRFIHISCFEDRSKNITGILHALSRLKEKRNDFECIMVGEGIDLERMQLVAKELGLKEPVVKFTGLLENEDLIKVYQSADFMVMFSNYENMPVVISESFSCGIPVIATSVGGIPEYVNRENGRLVTAGEETELLDAIIHMLDHYQEFSKENIRQFALHNFGTQAVAERMKELYSYATP